MNKAYKSATQQRPHRSNNAGYKKLKNLFMVIFKRKIITLLFSAIAFFIFPVTGITQAEMKSGEGLFDSDSVLQITLRGNIRDLLNDRGDDPKYHSIVVSYSEK